MKLSDVLKHRKGFVTINDDAEYKLCRVQLHNRGVVQRGVQKGYEIKTKKQQICRAGDFIVAEMDAKLGGYGFIPDELDGAIVSSHYYLFELDLSKIKPKYLEALCKLGILQYQIKAVGSTNYAAIRPRDVLDWNIPDIDYSRQLEIERIYESISQNCNSFKDLLNKQLGLVDKLRQAILREAMQGKLVPQDPSDEPASELLKRIKAERAQLIKEKKLKPGKELPPIKPEEIPYPIPDSWIWCRLGDVFTTITKGSSPKWQGVSYAKNRDDGVLFITSKNVREYTLDLSEKTYVDKRFNDIEPRSILKRGDFLTNIVGASIGRTAYFDLEEQANINQAVCILRKGHQFVNDKYLLYIMNSNLIVSQMLRAQFAPGRANLSMGNLSSFVIPLPPQEEQNRISMQLNLAYHECNSLLNSLYVSEEYTTLLQDSIMNKALGLM